MAVATACVVLGKEWWLRPAADCFHEVLSAAIAFNP